MAEENKMNHFDKNGNAIMVDVSEKNETHRTAIASGEIHVCEEIFSHVMNGTMKKGDVLGVARIGGIMGCKQTCHLIPLCHPIVLNKCSVEFETEKTSSGGIIRAICTVKSDGRTGVEMEALTGVSVALLSVYDMCKAVDKGMVIKNIHLEEKSGGKSGDFHFTA